MKRTNLADPISSFFGSGNFGPCVKYRLKSSARAEIETIPSMPCSVGEYAMTREKP